MDSLTSWRSFWAVHQQRKPGSVDEWVLCFCQVDAIGIHVFTCYAAGLKYHLDRYRIFGHLDQPWLHALFLSLFCHATGDNVTTTQRKESPLRGNYVPFMCIHHQSLNANRDSVMSYDFETGPLSPRKANVDHRDCLF